MNARGERRVIEAGDSALLLQIGARQTASQSGAFDVSVNREAVAIAALVRSAGLAGVQDVISTYRSVAVFFNPLEADVEQIRSTLQSCAPKDIESGRARQIEVPVVYGGEWGPDLDDVAAFAGCDRDIVIERHAARSYRVFMLGFLPGYPYMASVDPSIAAPRRPTPRVSIPAGSVGIAGQQTGIYPTSSPGGWQIIGWTPLNLFDPDRTPPTLFAPGDEVRFVPQVRLKADTTNELKADTTAEPSMRVVKPGLMTTVQDRGRWGYQHLGVPPAGPMDPAAHDRANALVGNTVASATLEATLVGPDLRFERPVRVAITGAEFSADVDGDPMRHDTAMDCAAGSVLRFGARKSGGRAYIGFAGGIDVPAILGSRATHVQSGMGGVDGRMLRAGDSLTLGEPDKARPTAGKGRAGRAWPSASIHGGARLRVMRGPQADLFDSASFAELHRARFIISPQSNRMGYRLTGARIPAASFGDMLSDATFTGALQVPPSGDPILLMADRQTTGGYPQMAVVIAADMPLAGQLLPGDWIEFELCTRADAIAALRSARPADGVA